jgi:hypothetical protein
MVKIWAPPLSGLWNSFGRILNRKRKLIVNVGIPLIALLMIGSGVLIGYNVAPKTYVLSPPGSPMVAMDLKLLMRGQTSYVAIYQDGTILSISDKNLRIPIPPVQPIRTWKTGKLSQEDLARLDNFLMTEDFEGLNDYYNFGSSGDMYLTVSISDADLIKTVRASGYLSSDNGATYPELPAPLNDLYKRLYTFAMNNTAEVAQEVIK